MMENQTHSVFEEKLMHPQEEAKVYPVKTVIERWFQSKENILINTHLFNDYYEPYELSKPDSYTNTRNKRFNRFIEKELISPLLSSSQASLTQEQVETLTQTLQQLLSNLVFNDHWQHLIHSRLTTKKQVLKGHYINFLDLNNSSNGLQIRHAFTFIEHESNSKKLFQGESSYQITLKETAVIKSALETRLELFDEKFEADSKTPTLTEEIEAYMDTLSTQDNQTEITLLKTAKRYYLDDCSPQALQESLISTTTYDADFKCSDSFSFLKKILQEKPIKGFSL